MFEGTKPFRRLYEEGILTAPILDHCWRDLSVTIRQQLLGIMLKEGLIVAFDQTAGVVTESLPRTGYIVPSLLPTTIGEEKRPWRPTSCESKKRATVLLACYTGSGLFEDSPLVCKDDLRRRCMLPAGLFDQLLAVLAEASQASQLGGFQPVLTREFASFRFGRGIVELRVDDDIHAVHIDVYERHAALLLKQIRRGLQRVVSKPFLALECEFLTRLSDSEVEDHFVRLEWLQGVADKNSEGEINLETEERTVQFTPKEVRAKYESVLLTQPSDKR